MSYIEKELPRASNQIGVAFRGPSGPDDIVVPHPREFLSAELEKIRLYWQQIRVATWTSRPEFSFPKPLTLAIKGTAHILYPTPLVLDTAIDLPALDFPSDTLERSDRIALVTFLYWASLELDPKLAMQFNYIDPNTEQELAHYGELAGRLRLGWCLVLSSQGRVTREAFIQGLTDKEYPVIQDAHNQGGYWKVLSPVNNTAVGFKSTSTTSSLRIYALDPNLAVGKAHPIFTDFIDVLDVCNVRRIANIERMGYTYGLGGEAPLTVGFNIEQIARTLMRGSQEDRMRDRLMQEVFAGRPGRSATLIRSVQNFAAGPIAGNPGAAGMAAASPNGSVCLPSQRISFTNQAWTETRYAMLVQAGNDGSGNGLISVALNAPAGSYFSENKADHKIYSLAGTEESAYGTFANLGGSGFLTWTSGANSRIKPGSPCYFVPAFSVPSGSGFDFAFSRCEKMWITESGRTLLVSPGNIRMGYENDPTAYQEPANNETIIAVFGTERQVLHYALEAITVKADESGTITIPANRQGCFAFVEGVTNPSHPYNPNRIDKPVVSGLKPGSLYRALIYRPPQQGENWQFQFIGCQYQGVGSKLPNDWLNGATVISKPLFFIHTHGSGGAVWRSEASIQYVPIASHLPRTNTSLAPYRFDSHTTLVGEPYQGSSRFRELSPISGAGLAIPVPGQKLSVQPRVATQLRSLSMVIQANGRTLGFKMPVLSTRTPFQGVLAFVVEKNDTRYILVATSNGMGGQDVALDSDTGTGIDLFEI
jgi:hypothetical protein